MQEDLQIKWVDFGPFSVRHPKTGKQGEFTGYVYFEEDYIGNVRLQGSKVDYQYVSSLDKLDPMKADEAAIAKCRQYDSQIAAYYDALAANRYIENFVPQETSLVDCAAGLYRELAYFGRYSASQQAYHASEQMEIAVQYGRDLLEAGTSLIYAKKLFKNQSAEEAIQTAIRGFEAIDNQVQNNLVAKVYSNECDEPRLHVITKSTPAEARLKDIS